MNAKLKTREELNIAHNHEVLEGKYYCFYLAREDLCAVDLLPDFLDVVGPFPSADDAEEFGKGYVSGIWYVDFIPTPEAVLA